MKEELNQLARALENCFTSIPGEAIDSINLIDGLGKISSAIQEATNGDSFISHRSVLEFGQYIERHTTAVDRVADGLELIAEQLGEVGATGGSLHSMAAGLFQIAEAIKAHIE